MLYFCLARGDNNQIFIAVMQSASVGCDQGIKEPTQSHSENNCFLETFKLIAQSDCMVSNILGQVSHLSQIDELNLLSVLLSPAHFNSSKTTHIT